MMITIEQVIELVPSLHPSASGQYKGDCPLCHKTEKFFINAATLAWDCKKCGAAGRIAYLLKRLGATNLLETKPDISKPLVIVSLLGAKQDVAIEEKDDTPLPPISMPSGYTRVFQDDYLDSRGFVPADYFRHNFGRVSSGRLSDYIIMSITQGGQIVAYVARHAGAKGTYDEKYKYYNPKGVKFSKALYGIDSAQPGDTVVLLEGVFDKVALDRYIKTKNLNLKTCVTFGAKMSETQQQMLLRKGVAKIIFGFEADAIEKLKKLGKQINRTFDVFCYSVPLGVDFGDMTETEIESVLKKETPFVNFNYEKVLVRGL